MDLLKNILRHFKSGKNTKNAATFNEIIVKTVTEAKTDPEISNDIENNKTNPESEVTTVPETSNDIENKKSKPETEANDSANSQSMENFEKIEIITTNAEFKEIDVASGYSNIPSINNNIDFHKNNNKNNIEENQNDTDAFSNELQDNTNNKLSNNLNVDENTMKCIEEFDTILGNLQGIHEPIYLDEFERLIQENEYLLNIDTEESIPVHVISKNDTSEKDTKLNIEDDTDMKKEKIELEVHGNVERNVKLDSTEIEANTEVTLMRIDGNNTKTDRIIESNSADFENNSEKDNPKSLEIDTNVVREKRKSQETCPVEFNTNIEFSMETDNSNTKTDENIEIDSTNFENNSEIDISMLETISNVLNENMEEISQERSLIVFDSTINVDNSQEATVIKFDNSTVNNHSNTSLTVVNSIKCDTNELENTNEYGRKMSPIEANNSNLIVENNTETIIQQDNNVNQDVDSNITDNKEATMTKISHLIEITLTKISNSNNDKELNKVEENLEMISISSDEVLDLDVISINSDKTTESDCGYHSSDFEFISENEAKLDGFIINYRPKDTSKTADENQNNFEAKNLENSPQKSPKTVDENKPGPSGVNTNNNYESYRNRYARLVLIDRTYRDRHEVLEGEAYMDLFRGMYNPVFTSMVENKSLRTNSMQVELERQLIGRRRDSSEDEYENDAEETADKIRQMYPGENKKRRRRF